MDSVRIIVEVVAGVIPQTPEPEYTRRYHITSGEWDAMLDDSDKAVKLVELNGRAQGYAAWLMMQPDRVNWVRVDWLWL